ncbi:P-loop containing nucleoside triphosphate hydrolase protein [Laetiporus sulphureus 93-53]|uniref:p-loop containing nucleoside triphosphate hydrolase protein n=1 Tax=Laetiporus sulphureus 93-53 TaxID=1314785 RepID=A0A165GE93_9APHY|nr:P-loop containing nucleoside triphosphate hydrolase protein [Laetiporus sulphureus 93-53]KZT10226.1 P-loop containing nucleoside triphosphate hydrolase protein [Laetiporus sulphureus 93-53]
MADTISDTVKYVLQNKGSIQTHMAKHKATWGPEPPAAQVEEGLIEAYVRVRPLLEHDLDCGAFSLIDIQGRHTVHFTHPTVRAIGGRFSTKSFSACSVFGADTDNDSVYTAMNVAQTVQQCLDFNRSELSVLAYGQTGTGKTYTTTALEERIISHICQGGALQACTISVEAFEIRGLLAYDLLSTPSLAPIRILAAGSGAVNYLGLTRHSVLSQEQLSELLSNAKELRLTRSTVKNSTSSRSHSIIRIHIESKEDGSKKSCIHIIDLAGSERSNILIQNDAERMKESIETNKSLAALKDCIRARLSSSGHVPWRGSRLTMVLKDIFDRSQDISDRTTSKLMIVACVSPSPLDVEDTLNTLRYVTVFQLNDGAKCTEMRGTMGLTLHEDAMKWGHAESVDYITRNYSKLAPVLHRLLRTPTVIMADLLPLSAAELSKLCSTPTPEEESGSLPAPNAREVAQAKSWLTTYRAKMDVLVQKSQALHEQIARLKLQNSVSAGNAVLRALDGRDPMAGETGLVTRIDGSGRAKSHYKRSH